MKTTTFFPTLLSVILALLLTTQIHAQYAGGDGSAGDPYQIATAAQLNNVRNDLDAHFILTADIDLDVAPYNTGSGWEGIGSSSEEFTGTFNGKGHVITGLYINSEFLFVGFFNFIGSGATIDSLGLEDVDIFNTNSVFGGLAGVNQGTISNCYVTGNVELLSEAENVIVGGLAGYNNGGTISNSYFSGSVIGGERTGGLVAYNAGTISNSYATGSVEGRSNTGGLVGQNSGATATIEFSYSTSNVIGTGIVGGLVGDNEEGSITNSYAAGPVSGNSDVGGLAGTNDDTIINSYWNTETSGQASSAGGTGLTTTQMAQSTNFSGWDFVNNWSITEDETYPWLQWQGSAGTFNNLLVGPPFALEANPGVDTVGLSWTSPPLASPDSFKIYRNDVLVHGIEISVGGDQLTDTTWTDTTVIAFVNYTYEVSALYDTEGVESVLSPRADAMLDQALSGSGTSGDPWLISTVQELNGIRLNQDSHYKLTADLDLGAATDNASGILWNNGEGWEPIGSSLSDDFTGSLDGNGHTITGLFIDRDSEDNVGLFGYINGGSVDSLGLEAVDVTGNNNTGGVAGYSSGTITASHVSGSVTGNDWTGGLAGYNDEGSISRSFSNTDVVGGFSTGSLVGTNAGTITNTYAAGTTDPVDQFVQGVGGLVGANTTGGTINTSYATGPVKTDHFRSGGLIGNENHGSESNNFYNTETTGKSSSYGGTGLTTAQMLDSTNFSNFDFEEVWDMADGHGFPFLRGVGSHRTNVLELTGSEGWRMISSPMDGLSYQTLLDSLWTQGFTGADHSGGTSNVYTWSEANRQFESILDASDIPDAGTGMLVYVYDDQDFDGTPDGFPKTILLEGDEDSGAISPALSYNDTGTPADDGWNLVGNPYGATIDWDAASGWTKTNLDATFYVWSDSANSGTGAYLTWNGAAGSLPGGKIAPWQGFWVQANAGSPNLEFTDDVRSAGGVFYKREDEEPVPQIIFSLAECRAERCSTLSQASTLEAHSEKRGRFSQPDASGGLQSSAVVMFAEEAAPGKDRLDGWKLASLNGHYLSLYTTTPDGGALDINALPPEVDQPMEVPMDFKGSDLGGKYTLRWNPQDLPVSLTEGVIILTDIHNDKEIDLSEAGEYTFEISTTQKETAEQPSPESGVGSATPADKLSALRHGPIPTVLKAKASNPRFLLTIQPKKQEESPLAGIPAVVELAQNYPNPFNPATVIRYGVPAQSKVTLTVFDVLGRKVATLLDEQRSPGRYQLSFDGSRFASGLYFYRLKVGSNIITKKMTLIK